MISRFLLLLLMLFASWHIGFGQIKIRLDSLNLALENAKVDSTKIDILLGITKLYQGEDYSLAIHYGLKALELSEDNQLPKFEAKSNRALGVTYYAMGDYKNSVQYNFRALSYYESAKDTVGLIAINNNLGAVYDRLSNFDKAIVYYLKARDLLAHYSDQAFVARIQLTLFNNIGNVYQTRGEIASAIEYYKKALLRAQELNHQQIQGIVLNNLGKLYLTDLKDFDQSLTYLQKGLEVRLQVGDKSEISRSHNNLAEYYRLAGQFDKAKEEAKKAIRLGQEIGALETQKISYNILSDVEEELQNYRESLEAFRMYKNLSDSIQSQLASSEITRLQLNYDFERTTQEREHQEKIQRNRLTVAIIILSSALLFAILTVFLIRARAKQAELKRKNLAMDVEIKNKELTTNVMYLIRKNELINDVAERLLKLQPKVLPENRKVLHGIIIDLQREADNDTWKEFEVRFNQVHTEFYTNLRKLYPDLSPAEEKLCAFLRLNMSSKEVAAITQQSIKSVEVARARLRKKLDLTGTTSNLVTHLSHL